MKWHCLLTKVFFGENPWNRDHIDENKEHNSAHSVHEAININFYRHILAHVKQKTTQQAHASRICRSVAEDPCDVCAGGLVTSPIHVKRCSQRTLLFHCLFPLMKCLQHYLPLYGTIWFHLISKYLLYLPNASPFSPCPCLCFHLSYLKLCCKIWHCEWLPLSPWT